MAITQIVPHWEGPIFAFGIDRSTDYTGYIKKDFLHWDFLFSSLYM